MIHEDLAIDQQIENNDQFIKEVKKTLQTQEEYIDRIFQSYEVDRQEFLDYFANPENFSAEEWTKLEELRIDEQEKLDRQLANVANPKKVLERYEEQRLAQHWIFVR